MAILNIRVADIMKREYPVVDKDETLEHAIRVMKRYDSDRVLAVEGGKLIGIMTKKDIMLKLATLRTKSVSPGRMHVSSFMSWSPKTVSPDTRVVDVASMMINDNIGSYPVVRGDEILGLITRVEIAELAKEIGYVKAVDVMVSIPEALYPTNKLLHARQIALRYNLLFIPVVDEVGRLAGYITVDDIADAFLAFYDIVPEKFRKEKIDHLVVDDIIRLRPPVVSPEDTLDTVVEEVLSRRSKGAAVVHGEKPIGIISLVELVKAVASSREQQTR